MSYKEDELICKANELIEKTYVVGDTIEEYLYKDAPKIRLSKAIKQIKNAIKELEDFLRKYKRN